MLKLTYGAKREQVEDGVQTGGGFQLKIGCGRVEVSTLIAMRNRREAHLYIAFFARLLYPISDCLLRDKIYCAGVSIDFDSRHPPEQLHIQCHTQVGQELCFFLKDLQKHMHSHRQFDM